MPTIQKYDKRVLPPAIAGQKMMSPQIAHGLSVQIPADVAGAPYRAVSRATGAAAESMESLKRLGSAVSDLGSRMVKIDQDTQYNKAVTGAQTKLNERLAEMQQRPLGDHKKWNDEILKLGEELHDQLGEDLVGPWRRDFDAQFDQMRSHTNIKVAGLVRQRTIEEAKAQLDVDISSGLQALGQTTNPIERRNIVTRLAARVDQDSQNGLLLPTRAVAKKLAIREAWAGQEIAEKLMADPRRVLAALKEGPKTEQGDTKHWDVHYYLNMLPGHKRVKIQEAAEKRVKALEVEHDKLQLTRADLILRQEHGKGYADMRGALRDPAVYQKKLGLTIQQATQLRKIYKGLEDISRVEDERASKQRAYAGIKSITDLQAKGKVAEAFAALDAVRDDLPADTYRTLKQDLTQARLQTTKADWAQLLVKLRDDEPPTLLQAIGLGLKPDKYEDYLKGYQARVKELKKTGPRTDQVKLAIGHYDRMMGSGNDADQDLARMRPDFINSIIWFQKKQKLEADDPKVMEFAKRLLEPYVQERVNWGFDTKHARLLDVFSDQRPWITGSMPQYKEPMIDLDLLHASQDERFEVQEMLDDGRIRPTLYTKRRALTAMRQGVEYHQVNMPGPLQGVPTEAIEKIRRRLKTEGRDTSPLSIREVWDRMGRAIVMRWK